jgi:hypothetical protein
MRHGSYLIALLITFASFSLLAAGIQKWVDKDGNVHYGDQPPPGSTASQINVDSTSQAGGGLRAGERERLRQIEAEERSEKNYRNYTHTMERNYKAVDERDKQYRCSQLDRMYASGRHKKTGIIDTKRRLGCP